MTREHWLQIKTVYQEALAHPAEARENFLEQACAGNFSLREEVNALLAAHQPAEDFFNRLTRELGQTPELPWRGRKLGAYRLLEELGHGGMGAVYLAERADQHFEKQVAVKIVPQTLWNDELARRFHHERQILARLEHPHIARLLDGGATEEGLPYLVMEYVKGAPLDRFCDAQRLNVSARLRLFREVCAAVDYAHRHDIIHRDLKPANILVTSEGAPKLLDFGIAKIMSANNESLGAGLTRTGFLPMTPEYASPEQVRGEDVTPASDIYALGVLLYLLLTGHAPYRFHKHSPQEIARIVCEHEPELPSRIIFKTNDVAQASLPADKSVASLLNDAPHSRNTKLTPEVVSACREGTPSKLRRRLAGDLDNIVLKALRKEPERRYASVEEFSEDIRRHLEGLPVKARKNSLWYRGGKIMAREKRLLLALGVIAVLLAGFLWIKPALMARLEEIFPMLEEETEIVCRIEPARSSYVVGKENTMTVTMRIGGLPMAGIPARFEVMAGPNRGVSGSATTNTQGQASLAYRSRGSLGTDTIRVATVYEDSTYVRFAHASWLPQGTLFGPLGAPVGKLKSGDPIYGGISCEGYRFSESVIEAHGLVTLQRIADNRLALQIELRHGDPNFTYAVEVFEAGNDCVSSDLGATGVFLAADEKGNGHAEVILQLPYAPPQQHVLGDGKGTEALIVVLHWVDAQKGGDRFSTDAMPLPTRPNE